MIRRLGRATQLAAVMACALLIGCRGPQKSRWVSEVPSAPRPAASEQTPESTSTPGAGERNGAGKSAAAEPNQIARVSLEETEADGEKKGVESAALAWADPVAVPPLKIESGTPETPADILSLEELQQLATAGNPTLRQAQGLLEQAEGNWLQSGLYPNPTLGYNGQGNNGPFDMQGGYLAQNLVTANKLGLNRAVASYDVQRAQWEAEAQGLRVVNEIRIRYTAALGTQRQVAVAQELLRVADQGVKISEQLLESEQVSRADVLQARLQRNQTLIVLRNAQFRSTAAWQQLGNVIGTPDLPPRLLEGNLEDGLPEVDWEFAWQRLANDNPLLRAARARAAAAQLQVRREQVQKIPDLQLTGYRWNDSIHPPNVMYGVNVGVTVPIWDRNQGNIAAAMGELRASQAEISRLELSLRDLLAGAYQRYQTARNQVQLYRNTILPTARENLDLTQKAYEEGEFDFVRVLTARRDLFQANIDYVNALIDLRTAVIEIEGLQLTGGLDQVVSNPTRSNQAGQTNGPGQ
ncbi:MAG TPA: TolC family protein [Planctomycetaceae bacterium]|nr:TolC family protein [Planctomycetaceae bacterium]